MLQCLFPIPYSLILTTWSFSLLTAHRRRPLPPLKARAVMARDPSGCRSRIFSLQVTDDHTHTNGARPHWPVATVAPSGCTAIAVMSSARARMTPAFGVKQTCYRGLDKQAQRALAVI